MRFNFANTPVADRFAHTHTLAFEVNIDSAAAPVISLDLGNGSDACGTIIIRDEDDTATADCIECPACWDNGWTTPVNCTGIMGLLIVGSKLLEGTGLSIDKVYGIRVETSTGTVGITKHGDDYTRGGVAEQDGKTTAGNIAFSIDSNQNYDSQDLRYNIVVEFSTRA